MLRLGTVFSGIGAVEHALEKLNIPYEIKFACDNGERKLKVKYEDVTYCISFYENVHQNYESIYDNRTDLYFTHQCIEEHYNDSPIKMNFYLEGKSIQNPIAVLSIQYLYESTGEEFHFAYHPKILKESDIKVTKIPYNYFKTVFFNDYETVMCSLQKENLKDPFFVIDISYTTELKTVQ